MRTNIIIRAVCNKHTTAAQRNDFARHRAKIIIILYTHLFLSSPTYDVLKISFMGTQRMPFSPALSAQHISASTRSTCPIANRYQNIYRILHTVTHRVFHTYSTGARLQIAFIFLAKRLHFALKSIQNRISIIGYHPLLWNRYHPVVFALDGNRQRAKQTDLLL